MHLTAIGDSVDEVGEISITEASEWWKKIGTYDSRNPEAFNTDGGNVWTRGEKDQVIEDKFFYIPETFGWLGEGFKGVKSLVSGIGLKITSVVGPKFTKDMKGIGFRQIRRVARSTTNLNGGGALSRKIDFKRVAYYKPDENKKVLEMGEEVCALNLKVNNQDVFLFVGFAEVATGNQYEGGHEWNFQKNSFFKKVGSCANLRGWMTSNPRLILDRIGNAKDPIQGDGVIMLGRGKIGSESSNGGVYKFSEKDKGGPLVGFVMGLAINVAQKKECMEQLASASQKEMRESVRIEAIKCIERERDELGKRVKSGTVGGDDLLGKVRDSLHGDDGESGDILLTRLKGDESNVKITSSDKLLNAGRSWKEFKGSIELSYKYIGN